MTSRGGIIVTSPVSIGIALIGISLVFATEAIAQVDAKKDRVAPAGEKAAPAGKAAPGRATESFAPTPSPAAAEPMPLPDSNEAVQANVGTSNLLGQPNVSKQKCEADLLKDVAWRQSLTNELRELVALRPRPIDTSVYVSPIRELCTKAMRQDTGWRSHIRTKYLLTQVRAEIRAELRPDVHAQDTELILRNRRHVVMAYAALWVIVVIFVVILWLRQRSLSREIGELETQLARAIAEDAKS